MRKVLFVDCCIRREESNTKRLADCFMENLPKDTELTALCLMDEPIEPFREGFFAQRERLLQQERGREHPRFRYAWQFREADIIVIAAPFWDLGFPALLKTYMEHVSVDGITFICTEQGLKGVCKAKEMVFLTTRGGCYEGSPQEMGSRYMEALSRFFGIESYCCIAADGVNLDMNKTPAIMAEACERAVLKAKSL